MTKKEARAMISQQKQTLNAQTIVSQQWLDETHEFIRKIFGTSEESLALPMYGTYYNLHENRNDIDKAIRELDKFFDKYLGFIDKGLYKVDPEKTFIDGFKDSTIRKWFFTIATISFFIGYIYGAYDNPGSMFYRMLNGKIERTING